MSKFPLSTLVEPTTLFIRKCVFCDPHHLYENEYSHKIDAYGHVEISTGMCNEADRRLDEISLRLLTEDLNERVRLVEAARKNLEALFS